MNLPKTFRLGLAAKVAVCVIASTAAFFSLFGYINLRSERRHFQEQVEVLSLIGDVALKDGKPVVHAHLIVVRKKCISTSAGSGAARMMLGVRRTQRGPRSGAPRIVRPTR